MNQAKRAIDNAEPPVAIARAAVRDALDSTSSEKERAALARDLYKEATGRFPQESTDRNDVFKGGFWLLGVVFVTTAITTATMVINGATVPEWIGVFATALVSGVLGGLFGYAQQ